MAKWMTAVLGAGLLATLTHAAALADQRYNVEVDVTEVATIESANTGGMAKSDFYMVFDSPSGRRKVTPRVDNRDMLTGDLLDGWTYAFRHTCESGRDCVVEITAQLCDHDTRRRDCATVDLTPNFDGSDEGIATLRVRPDACVVEADDGDMEGNDTDGVCTVAVTLEGDGSGPDAKARVELDVMTSPR